MIFVSISGLPTYIVRMSYVAINMSGLQQPQLLEHPRNSTRSFKTARFNATNTTNTTNTVTSFASARSYNKHANKYNARIVNTNDPNWLSKEGVNTSYNMNLEARKRWLERQPFSALKKPKSRKNRKTRKI